MGIGGGGDCVGALAAADLCAAHGVEAVLGGTTWERRPVDPLPGPRRLDEVVGLAERLHEAVGLATGATTGPGGVRFAESRLAGHLGEPVLLVDPTPGPAAVADGLRAAATRLEADLVVLLDVGGDVLGRGDEPGLASPLCDAIFLAAAPLLTAGGGPDVLLAVVGIGCDGELTPDEVLARLAETAAAGGLVGAWGITPGTAARLAGAVEVVPTEASAQALACARGAHGPAPIRGGRRSVVRGPAGAVVWVLEPAAALRGPARLAAALDPAEDLHGADARIRALGASTELAWEERMADEAGAAP